MAVHDERVRPPKQPPFDIQAFLESGGVAGRVVAHRSGAVVYSQGDPCDSVLYIQKGGVKLRVISHAGKEAIVAMAVAMRTGCPARAPSPKKSPGPSIATVASLPAWEMTRSLTAPFWT